MRLTIYNLIASFVWSNVYILLFCLLRRRYAFLRDYGVLPLIGVLVVGAVRFFVPLELPFTVILPSTELLPAIQDAVRKTAFWGLSYGHVLLIIWGTGTAALLIRIIIGMLSQKRRISGYIRKDSSAAENALADILPNTIRHAAVIVSPDIPIPSVTGLLRPTFLLPEIALTETQLQHILRHELGHYLGRDAWLKLMIAIVKAIFWWNPFVYLLETDLDYVLEVRSDAYATKGFAAEQQIGYVEAVAEVLKQVGLAKHGLPNYALAISGVQTRDKLYDRMKLVFSARTQKKGKLVLLAVLTAASVFLSYSFIVQPEGHPQTDSSFIDINPENAYILHTKDGEYELYWNGKLLQTISEDTLVRAFNQLEVRKEK